MDQTTYFSFRCPECGGRSRVASRHAGQVIVCPYCQARATALPDTQPVMLPSATQQIRMHASGQSENPATSTQPAPSTRYARPLDPATTATIRRERAAERFGTELLPPMTPQAAPGMAGFADGRPSTGPGTASIRRPPAAHPPSNPATSSNPATPSSAPGTAAVTRNAQRPAVTMPPSQAPFMWAASAAALLTVMTILACIDASAQRTRWVLVKQQAEESAAALVHAQTTAEGLDKRLAQAQVELAAARAATTRERELVTELQKNNGRLTEELVKLSHANEAPMFSTTPNAGTVSAIISAGAFPTAVSPNAGVPTRANK